MKYNRNFAKREDGVSIVFAPAEFDYGGVFYNATNDEKIYNEMGYLKYVKSEMPQEENAAYYPYYEEKNGLLFQKWEKEAAGESEEEYIKAAKILLGEGEA